MKQGAPVYHEAGKPAPDKPAEKPLASQGCGGLLTFTRTVSPRVCVSEAGGAGERRGA